MNKMNFSGQRLFLAKFFSQNVITNRMFNRLPLSGLGSGSNLNKTKGCFIITRVNKPTITILAEEYKFNKRNYIYAYFANKKTLEPESRSRTCFNLYLSIVGWSFV